MTHDLLSERIRCAHPLNKKLLTCMLEKKTNIGFAADVTEKNSLLNLIHQVGPHICVLKTHIDILQDFTPDLPQKLRDLAEKYQFLIFEDRKFSDIGHTVQQQYAGGLYRIADWADIINAHILPGPGCLDGLKNIGLPKQRGLILLAQMSSAGNLLSESYTKEALALAEKHPDFVLGFIAKQRITSNPSFLHFTPGIQLSVGNDLLGQQYLTPEIALKQNKTDILLVGRGILNSPEPKKTAEQFQQLAWKLWQEG